MGTNFYLMSRNKKLIREHFAVETEYDIKDIEYAIVDEPYLGYEIHLNKLSCGWHPLFQRHKTIKTFKELEEFCLKNKSVIAYMMNMEEDIHGNNILKEYMSIVSKRNSHVNGYMISIQLSPIVDHVYKMYHVLNRRQKYIFHSVIENITKRKSWRRNAFM